MTETLLSKFVPEKVSPIRNDPPGAVTAMPSPTKIHHVHVFSDERYDDMVEFYQRILNAKIVTVHEGPAPLTFLRPPPSRDSRSKRLSAHLREIRVQSAYPPSNIVCNLLGFRSL